MNKIERLNLSERVKDLAAQGYSRESISQMLKEEGNEVSHMAIQRFLTSSDSIKEEVGELKGEIDSENKEIDIEREKDRNTRTLAEIREIDTIIEIARKQVKYEQDGADTYISAQKPNPIYR